MKIEKTIKIELTTEDMQAAVKEYVKPKLEQMFADEITRGARLNINHPFIDESYVSVTVEI